MICPLLHLRAAVAVVEVKMAVAMLWWHHNDLIFRASPGVHHAAAKYD